MGNKTYALRLWSQFLHSIRPKKSDYILALLVAIIIEFVFFLMGWIPRGEGLKTAFGLLAGPLIAPALFAFCHFLRTPVLLDRELNDKLKAKENMLAQIRVEWLRAIPVIKRLGYYRYEGVRLKDNSQIGDELRERLIEWNKGVSNELLEAGRAYGDRLKYRQRFYSDSKSFDEVPAHDKDLRLWVYDRTCELDGILKEIEGRL